MARPPEPTPKSALEIIHERNGYLDIFSRPQVKILDNICFSEQIFHRKLSLGAPDTWTLGTTALRRINAFEMKCYRKKNSMDGA